MTRKINKTTTLIIILVALAVGALAFCLLFEKNTTTKTEVSGDNMYGLYCEANAPKNTFLSLGQPISERHQIRINGINGSFQSISYIVDAEYENDDKARRGSDAFTTSYNLYIQGLEMDIMTFFPSSSTINNSIRVSIFAEKSKLDQNTGKLFFLDEEIVENLNNVSSEDLSGYYEQQNFVCEINK